ncbi:hypothetical protein FPZ43_10455 [Mucilaginibacter pallidiroseus]|uniref:Uncharacterized protein n=1 Tax=Mucilaginibacter pallidiroseus TaxID=2599295 RepID=A0A563UDD5_9SPHI|nr:hypothetical protein [Mucilaginibacter pallidiroseus]TWR29368.1 hypothetical protein FPZ43_10455 [Mucilaginibacter pallidiroseus]
MVPLFFTVGGNRPVKILPNIQAQADGHPVLTYTYNIYSSANDETPAMESRQEAELLLEKKLDPNYLGHLAIEDPGKLFTYIADGNAELSTTEVQEVIENIMHYRNHPGLWNLDES